MKCFYHAVDLDGQCSGAIVRHKFPQCELLGTNHGDPFPWDRIKPGEAVVMVDFALQPFEDMVKLGELTDLIWIDHHPTAIDESTHYDFCPKGLRRVGEAACELTWKYFFGEEIPAAVHLIGRHDVWDLSDERALPFHYGLGRYETDPSGEGFWRDLFEPPGVTGRLHAIVQEGKIIHEYVRQDNAKYAEACAFDAMLDGLKCLAVNRMLSGSQLFESLWDNKKYDVMLAFGYRRGQWHISLYSDKEDIDVSEIAKQRGGGGHRWAAGFRADTFPFTPFLRPEEE